MSGSLFRWGSAALLTGYLAITGCAETVTRADYETARKRDAETIQTLRDELTAAKDQYIKSLTDLKTLLTERTSIDALIPKVGEAKEDILKKHREDYDQLTKKWTAEKDILESTRRDIVAYLEQQKRWLKQTAEEAIGRPAGSEGPATGIYADREKIDNHETRLGKFKNTLVERDRIARRNDELYRDYNRALEQDTETLQHKLAALGAVKPEERAAALDAFVRDIETFKKTIEQLHQQEQEKRKEVPPQPNEKHD